MRDSKNFSVIMISMTLNENNKYLLTYLIALIILTTLLWGVSLNYSSLNFIILGFCWNFTIKAPTLRERILLKKYKFSFLKFIFRLDDFLGSFSESYWKNVFLRSLPPILISFFSYFLSSKGWFILTLAGSAYFELIYYLRLRQLEKKLDSVE
ncbi:hypothetical protein [Halobacteriovorax sp. HLS]|uniref:hypothetical protein n=1 Tax=Halobacteriovorax sp. HLS TaxID=2234000 RepID=UPI000FD7B97E|nr:hypothetical protein [Halobacteriovorax sp. HLS]